MGGKGRIGIDSESVFFKIYIHFLCLCIYTYIIRVKILKLVFPEEDSRPFEKSFH